MVLLLNVFSAAVYWLLHKNNPFIFFSTRPEMSSSLTATIVSILLGSLGAACLVAPRDETKRRFFPMLVLKESPQQPGCLSPPVCSSSITHCTCIPDIDFFIKTDL